MAGSTTCNYIGLCSALMRVVPRPVPLSLSLWLLSPATDKYRRFPNQTIVEQEDYNYFIEDINFYAVEGKLLVGAA